jgi:chemotaxis response regulator CheB
MGRDGALGCKAIRKTGGRVLVQDPAEAEVVSMPQTVIELGLGGEVHSLAALSKELEAAIIEAARKHGI